MPGTHDGACKGHETKGDELTERCADVSPVVITNKDVKLAEDFKSKHPSLYYAIKEGEVRFPKIVDDDGERVVDVEIMTPDSTKYVDVFNNMLMTDDSRLFKPRELLATYFKIEDDDYTVVLNPEMLERADAKIKEYIIKDNWDDDKVKEVAILSSGLFYGLGKVYGEIIREDIELQRPEHERAMKAQTAIRTFHDLKQQALINHQKALDNGIDDGYNPKEWVFHKDEFDDPDEYQMGRTSDDLRYLYEKTMKVVLPQLKADYPNYLKQKKEVDNLKRHLTLNEEGEPIDTEGIMKAFSRKSPVFLLLDPENVIKDEKELFPEMLAAYHSNPDIFRYMYREYRPQIGVDTGKGLWDDYFNVFETYPMLTQLRAKYLSKKKVEKPATPVEIATRQRMEPIYAINHAWEQLFTGASAHMIWDGEASAYILLDKPMSDNMSDNGYLKINGRITKRFKDEFRERGIRVLNMYDVNNIKPLNEGEHYRLTFPDKTDVRAYSYPELLGRAIQYSLRADRVDGKMKLAKFTAMRHA
jgi:hypothetical protein